MIASSRPTSRTDAADGPLALDDAAATPSSTEALFSAVFAFLCFMPYPAFPVGNNSAIQPGNVATGLALLCASVGMWSSITPAAILVILVSLVSTLKVLLIDGADASVCFRSSTFSAVPLLTLVVVQMLAPRHSMAMLTGIAVAILIHVAVGVLQVYSFASNTFPLIDLYVNQSFLSVQENASTIARWIQRPFGLFPEPSAMSSSIAPFILFFTAILLGVVKTRTEPSRWQRVLFASSVAGGIGLIIDSKSGHAVPTVAAMSVLLLFWMVQARATAKTYLLLLSLLCLALPLVLYFAFGALSDRVAGGSEMGNSSWEERGNSLLLGFKLWTGRGVMTTLFGLGPGMTSSAVEDVSGISAVFSVLFSYVYDSGLMGVLVVGWIGRSLFRVWRQSEWNPAYAAVAIVWIIGVTLTTSYEQLLPIWVALGLLTCWNAVCTPALPRKISMRLPANRFAPRRSETWISPWAAPTMAIQNGDQGLPTDHTLSA